MNSRFLPTLRLTSHPFRYLDFFPRLISFAASFCPRASRPVWLPPEQMPASSALAQSSILCFSFSFPLLPVWRPDSFSQLPPLCVFVYHFLSTFPWLSSPPFMVPTLHRDFLKEERPYPFPLCLFLYSRSAGRPWGSMKLSPVHAYRHAHTHVHAHMHTIINDQD